MSRRKKGEEGGANWMDTYGDMVTLLLCFFVLLYSISTVDAQKWEMVVKSFNPNAVKEPSQIVIGVEENEEGTEFEGAADMELENFEDLYYALSAAIKEKELEGEVELMQGEGYTFINFRDNVFFDGDSSILKEEGKQVLYEFAKALDDVSSTIDQVQVLGHTSQANPVYPNNPETDRLLSSDRAARVTAYLQEMSSLDPEKLVSIGYGQYRPIASFDTAEDRAKNRRVEILITKNDAVVRSLDEYYDQIYDISY